MQAHSNSSVADAGTMPVNDKEGTNHSVPVEERLRDLEQQNASLAAELAALRAENRALKRSLGELMWEDIEIDDDEALALAKTQPTMQELIAELEAMRD